MGQRFSVNVLFQDIKVVMSKYFPKIQIVKILNNGMLSQTLLILNEKDNTPLILKCFMKYDYDEADHKRHNAEIEKYKILQKVIIITLLLYY